MISDVPPGVGVGAPQVPAPPSVSPLTTENIAARDRQRFSDEREFVTTGLLNAHQELQVDAGARSEWRCCADRSCGHRAVEAAAVWL